jgi:8-oxo-dGTP diphosphatase
MYKIEFHDFFNAAFSVDCIIFGYEAGQIKALVIKRAMEPYNNYWAIPGDLVYPDEDLPVAAERVLKELTGLDHIPMHQSQTFGHPKRHPQGRVITISYFALVRIDALHVKASSFAEEISWVPINALPTLAFDHNHILESTYEILKQKLHHEPVCFDLLAERFTLHEFQQLYEFAFEQELDKANFRKKIKYIPLIGLEEKQKNVKHRPAKLYKFDRESYQKQLINGDYTFKM